MTKEEFDWCQKFIGDHRNAQEIVTNLEGFPLAAIYVTPFGDHQAQVKEIMRRVQDTHLYECEKSTLTNSVKEER